MTLPSYERPRRAPIAPWYLNIVDSDGVRRAWIAEEPQEWLDRRERIVARRLAFDPTRPGILAANMEGD